MKRRDVIKQLTAAGWVRVTQGHKKPKHEIYKNPNSAGSRTTIQVPWGNEINDITARAIIEDEAGL